MVSIDVSDMNQTKSQQNVYYRKPLFTVVKRHGAALAIPPNADRPQLSYRWITNIANGFVFAIRVTLADASRLIAEDFSCFL